MGGDCLVCGGVRDGGRPPPLLPPPSAGWSTMKSVWMEDDPVDLPHGWTAAAAAATAIVSLCCRPPCCLWAAPIPTATSPAAATSPAPRGRPRPPHSADPGMSATVAAAVGSGGGRGGGPRLVAEVGKAAAPQRLGRSLCVQYIQLLGSLQLSPRRVPWFHGRRNVARKSTLENINPHVDPFHETLP